MFEPLADFPMHKGALLNRLMATEPGPEEIVRGPDMRAKDEARTVDLSIISNRIFGGFITRAGFKGKR